MARRAHAILVAMYGTSLVLALTAVLGGAYPTDSAASAADGEGGEESEKELADAERFKHQILKSLDYSEHPRTVLRRRPSSANVSRRRNLKYHRDSTSQPVAASIGEMWADEGGSEIDALTTLRAEKGSFLPRDKDYSAVFTLKPADRDLRVSNAHLTINLADNTVLPASGSREAGRRDAARRPLIKVDIVHWDDSGTSYKTEPLDGDLQRLEGGRYSFDVAGNRLAGALEKSGRLELYVKCTNCVAQRSGRRSDAGAAAPAAIAFDLVLVGKRRGVKPTDSACDSRCCLRPLLVDFDQLGKAYNWIVSPRKFYANYCAGSCNDSSAAASGGSQRNRTAQSIVVDLMLQRQGKSLGSCCMASSRSPVQLIYKDLDGQFRNDFSQLYTTTACSCS